MAMARPVITTDAPGCRETVIDGVNGFLVPPRDASALADAMERFVLEPELIERMGAASRRIAEERFDVRRINRRMIYPSSPTLYVHGTLGEIFYAHTPIKIGVLQWRQR